MGTQFDADCILNGIASHVRAMKDRIGELESELANSSARNVELAKSEGDLAASPKVIETTASGRARAGEESVSIQGLQGEFQVTTARETELLTGQAKQASEANRALQSRMGSRRSDAAALQGRCDLSLKSATAASQTPVADLKRDFATLRSYRDPLQTSFDADAVLNGIAGHVQVMKDRIGELQSKLANSSARDDELAKSEGSDLAASPKVIKTTASGRSRVGEESVATRDCTVNSKPTRRDR